MKFEIENLSNGQADCFLITLENELKDSCTILVDGNRENDHINPRSEMLERISGLDKLDFILITHCDNDHLGGVLKLFDHYTGKSKERDLSRQLENTVMIYNKVTTGAISYKQAETFEQLVRDRKVINTCSRRYDNQHTMLKLLPIRIREILSFGKNNKNYAYLTFLNPDKDGINKVYNDYRKCCDNSKRKEYAALINRQSIAFMLEFAGKTVLFLGDATWKDIEKKLSVIPNLKSCNLIKIPHHGAEKNNVGTADWAKAHKCSCFMVTGAEVWDEKHPHKALIEELQEAFGENLRIYTKVIISIDGKGGLVSGCGTTQIDIINGVDNK